MTIIQKEFYFVRHGQTDHNISGEKTDHSPETPLNETGRKQAEEIEPIIGKLPVKAVCCSPYLRAQQTKEIITPKLLVPHYDIENIGECTASIWQTMRTLGPKTLSDADAPLRAFLERVRKGINEALLQPAPVLIVAHGGIHWALCSILNISGHNWAVGNCVPIHFFIDQNGQWTAKKLSS